MLNMIEKIIYVDVLYLIENNAIPQENEYRNMTLEELHSLIFTYKYGLK